MAFSSPGLAYKDQTNQSISQPPSHIITQSAKTYANAMSQPKKEQAIVMDSIEGLTIDDYIDGLETLIDTSSIQFLSKISGNRVCAFISNKTLVENTTNKTIIVKGHSINIRPLIEKNKRVVISNVCPVIPHEVLLEALKINGITPVSQMSHIRAGLNKPGRSHILSFRRQIYIKEELVHLLPETLQINFDNTTYWVYLTTDSTSCCICKQTGHIAKLCPKYNDGTNASQTAQQTSDEVTSKFPEIHNANEPIKTAIHQQETLPLDTNELKRRAPSSTISDLSTEEIPTLTKEDQPSNANKDPLAPPTNKENFKAPTKPAKKKPKNEIQTVNTTDAYYVKLGKILAPAKKIFDDKPEDHAVNYEQLQEFITRH